MPNITQLPLHIKTFFYQLDIPKACKDARDFDKVLRFREGCDECEFRESEEVYMAEDGEMYTYYLCGMGHWSEEI